MENRLKEIQPDIEEILLNAYKIKDILKIIEYAMNFCTDEGENTDNFISVIEILLSMTEEQTKQIDTFNTKFLKIIYNIR